MTWARTLTSLQPVNNPIAAWCTIRATLRSTAVVSCANDSGRRAGERDRWENPGTGAMTDAELIERASMGDPPAARALYHRYAPRVYAVVRRMAGDDDLAEDYAQEAWIRVFRALPDFRGDARFSTWIHRIAVNAALQGLRQVQRREGRQSPLPEALPAAPERGDPLLADRLERALDEVPERMRRVLILHDVEGYTHQDIGELMGISPGTSKSQLFKARAKMREILRDGSAVDADGLDAADNRGGMEAWNI